MRRLTKAQRAEHRALARAWRDALAKLNARVDRLNALVDAEWAGVAEALQAYDRAVQDATTWAEATRRELWTQVEGIQDPHAWAAWWTFEAHPGQVQEPPAVEGVDEDDVRRFEALPREF